MQQQDKSSIIEKTVEKVSQFINPESDIVSVIEEDHKPLKELIKIMQDSDAAFAERKQAFLEFAPLLLTHAKAEEKALYDYMKTKKSLREDAFEGEAEHAVADQLIEEIKRTTDVDQLSAKIKVLAESVDHHIQEEEREFLPEVRKEIGKEILQQLTATYIQVQDKVIAEGQTDSPSEAELEQGSLAKH